MHFTNRLRRARWRMPLVAKAVLALLIATSFARGMARGDDDAADASRGGRAKMHIPDVDETGIVDCLEMAVDAANKENLDGFLECFAASTRSSIRRQMALFFVRHEVAIDVRDKHFVGRQRNRAELVVNYTTSLATEEHEIVSFLTLVREDDRWVIGDESIVSRTVRRGRGSSDSACGPGGCPPAPCLGGRCGLPGMGFQVNFP